MKTFEIALTRHYLVTIEAENAESAARYSEFFLGDCPDLSTIKDQLDRKFSIIDIELAYNEAQRL